ncbi:MAG: hypothetical protein AAGF59_03775, partial [Pseudomonadota bacterium]
MTDEPFSPEEITDPTYVSPVFSTASRLVWTMLWCMQGMANLIEIYDADDPTKPAAVVLADFGSESNVQLQASGKNGTAPPVETIIQIIEKRGFLIDAIIVSHQDYDHWSLLSDLLYELRNPDWKPDDPISDKYKLKTGYLFLGGVSWEPKATFALKQVSDTVEELSIQFEEYYSSYHDSKNISESFLSYGNIEFKMLAVNGPNPETNSRAVESPKNASSAVVVVEWKNGCFILPGDATYQTLETINPILNNWITKFEN